MALHTEWSQNIPAVLRPLAAEEAEAAKDLPELHIDATTWVEGGQVWILELEPYQPETSPAGSENLEEIHQLASTEREDPDNLAKGVADSDSQSYESTTVPLASRQGTETAIGDREMLSQSSTLISNQKQKHHVCEQCDKSFKWPYNLVRHKQIHLGRKASGQRQKQKQSAMPRRQKSWVTTNHGKNSRTCGPCGKHFRWPCELAYHNKKVHGKSKATKWDQNKPKEFRPSLLHQKSTSMPGKIQKRQYTCNQCGKVFPKPSGLVRHQLTHSRRNEDRMNLNRLEAICPSAMVQAKNTFPSKILNEGSGGTTSTKNGHVCNQCGKGFRWRSSLARHQRHEHFSGNAVKPNQGQSEALMTDRSAQSTRSHICSQCGATFQFLSDLAQHKFIHVRRKLVSKHTQFKKSCLCGQCGKNFKWSSHLARHIFTHLQSKLRTRHPQGKQRTSCRTAHQKSYACAHCGKIFHFPSDCARHEWTHIRKQQKSHFCEHCGQSFTRGTDFILHMLTHPSERPYGCAICGFRFKYQVELKKHQKWHRGSCEMEENEVELGEKDHNSQHVHGQGLPDKSIPTDQLQRLSLQGFQEENRFFASLKSCECGPRYITASNSLGLFPQNSIWEIGISGVPHVLPLTQICECGYCGIDNGNFDMKLPEQPPIETGIAASAELPLAVPRSPSESRKTMAYMPKKTASTAHTWSHAMAGQIQKKSCSPIYLEETFPLADKKESFPCPKCSKEFRLFYYLKRHMSVHQPGKPYECPTCKMCFARRSYLQKHQKNHATNLRHKCPECGIFFTQATYLRKHMKRH